MHFQLEENPFKYTYRVLLMPTPCMSRYYLISSLLIKEMAACLSEIQVTPTNAPATITNNEQKDLSELPNFSITREALAKLLVDIDMEDSIPEYCGGTLCGIVSALETNLDQGIPGDGSDLRRRHLAFGPNCQDLEFDVDDQRHSMGRKSPCMLSFETFKDPTIILLLCCATLSLVIGIKRNGLQEGIRDGAMLFLAIFIVVNFGSACKFFKARRMAKKYSRNAKSVVRVVRGGTMQHIAVSQIVVGDVLCLESGDWVPIDGVLVYNQVLDTGLVKCKSIFSDTKVVEGKNCRVLVTSVGKNIERNRLMRSISRITNANEESRLKTQIEKMSARLEQICLRLSLLVLVVQVVRCFGWEAKFCDKNHEPDPKGVKNTLEEIMNETTKQMLKNRQGGGRAASGLVAVLCTLVFALRDGLPLGILVLFMCASKKMKSFHNARVQKLPACATLGLVTSICASATGDLTLDHTKMAAMWIGLGGTLKEVFAEEITRKRHSEVLNTLGEGICMSACGPEEDALLWWAKQALGSDVEEMNRSRTIIHRQAYDCRTKRVGLSLRRKGETGNIVHNHWKGSPDMILSMCSHYYDASDGTMGALDDEKRASFNEVITNIASGSLQCFAFAYKKVVSQEKLQESPLKLKEEVHQDAVKLEQDGLIFVGLVSLKSPFPPEVRKAINGCHKLGVKFNLVTSVDMQTASLMAIHSGILNQDERSKDLVIEASEFRNSSKAERQCMVHKIRVMANSSPSDKLLMVQCLRQNGEVVAATGTTVRDYPVLKAADVGLFVDPEESKIDMKDADMVMHDLNFGTIYSMLLLGRCACNGLGKFLEVHLILTHVALTVNFIVLLSNGELPLPPFELLWVNLIMEVLGALAVSMVATTSPSNQVYRAGPVVTKSMLRNFLVQSSYQVTVLLILYLKGKSILHVDGSVLKAVIFNCYVLCLVFVLVNARKIGKTDGSITPETVRRNENLMWFIAILGCIVTLQATVVEVAAVVLGKAGRLNLKQWCICIGVGSGSFLVDLTAKWGFRAISYLQNSSVLKIDLTDCE